MEYGTALRYFEELLRRANSEDLEAIDALVVERPEFSIYTNLARRLQSAPSALIPAVDSMTSPRPKQGFAWVMALARAEAGGVLATFASHPSPFEAIAPTEFEMSAYRELLLDGAQTHYWALANDPETRRVAKIEPNTLTLAYIRRLGVARHFLFAAVRSFAAKLNPTQIAEATTQKRQIEKLNELYTENVAVYMAAMNGARSQTTASRSQSSLVQACMAQLRVEKQALASGKATLEVKDNPPQ